MLHLIIKFKLESLLMKWFEILWHIHALSFAPCTIRRQRTALSGFVYILDATLKSPAKINARAVTYAAYICGGIPSGFKGYPSNLLDTTARIPLCTLGWIRDLVISTKEGGVWVSSVGWAGRKEKGNSPFCWLLHRWIREVGRITSL